MIVVFDKKNQRIPLKIWLKDLSQLEGTALEQAVTLTRLPFAYKQVALMPDAHVGYGMPIGGVLAAQDTIIPYAVGMDIGCGMHAVKTEIDSDQCRGTRLKNILGLIRTVIPQGFNWHKSAQRADVLDKMPLHLQLFQQEEKRVRKQLGTLGGGNHFIELQKDEENNLWVMIHSGSRNIGKQTAEHFHKKAKEFCRKKKTDLLSNELAFLPVESKEGQDYLDSMHWCLEFARESRRRMMEEVLDILQANDSDSVDIHHNYAVKEEHFGRSVWIHRKGATRAGAGERGVIPGSMGSASFIVSGRGNPESFLSCSHGAGRRMGRKAAKRKIGLESVLKDLEKRGVEISCDNLRDLPEEASQAYKNIDQVMNQQNDLVEVEVRLTPLGVVKG
ncbi:RNA-splicing ligase RtcB [candidate division LCP-89 bacterium B3_LCP]|uniref:3'-phosphate/5'-hydroxy nucleic acid ligase n=1 Tax=candidate division LCP-89 bacterium B3_LCP TaxID=2012998 RepID=A0A532V5M8_UNCL8|nr:MAG: RNA-splicing ligase RtcB [candidate division LCP-89 bacterium B3_LCP]